MKFKFKFGNKKCKAFDIIGITAGEALFNIHVAADADMTTQFTGEELQSHLEAVTGAAFNAMDTLAVRLTVPLPGP